MKERRVKVVSCSVEKSHIPGIVIFTNRIAGNYIGPLIGNYTEKDLVTYKIS